jgi:hypothetical protein
MPACKWCGQPIRFDSAWKSEKSDKYIPLEEDEDTPHNCPNNPYNAGGGSGSGSVRSDPVDLMGMSYTIQKMDEKMDSQNKVMLKLLLAVQTLQTRVEGQMPLDAFGIRDKDTGTGTGAGNSDKGTTDVDLSS